MVFGWLLFEYLYTEPGLVENIEQLMVILYDKNLLSSVNETRKELFCHNCSMDSLPTTQNALFSKLNGQFTKLGFGQSPLSGSITRRVCLGKNFICIIAASLRDCFRSI